MNWFDKESRGKTGEANASSDKDETVSQIRDVSDFVFVLDKCTLDQGNLTCMFNVTNEWGDDRSLVLVSAGFLMNSAVRISLRMPFWEVPGVQRMRTGNSGQRKQAFCRTHVRTTQWSDVQ